ncbi:hypothetical protein MKZ38_006878 [Zalerion maritima]|uniref:Uncharacterized protein n=1 Tax=Zalerion maritima TaxID=339359 RepID=A0AAD5RJL4_9PEZI|nr:hypothetical protein MKZ38_006878 [Zalerion maritima]
MYLKPDVTETTNFTKRGAQLGTFFQSRPDVWLKRLRNVFYFQAVMGVIALFVWIITWLKGMDKLLPDYDDDHLTDIELEQISQEHQNLFGGHIAMAAISAVFGGIAGIVHSSANYSKGVAGGIVSFNFLLVVGYSLTYYYSISFYKEHLDGFDTSVVGGLIVSCLSGFFTLIALLVELACVIVPAPTPKPPIPNDPFNRTVDPDRIPFLILELQDAFNYVLYNRNNLNGMNFQLQPGFQPPAPPFPLGARNNGEAPEAPFPHPLYPYPGPAPNSASGVKFEFGLIHLYGDGILSIFVLLPSIRPDTPVLASIAMAPMDYLHWESAFPALSSHFVKDLYILTICLNALQVATGVALGIVGVTFDWTGGESVTNSASKDVEEDHSLWGMWMGNFVGFPSFIALLLILRHWSHTRIQLRLEEKTKKGDFEEKDIKADRNTEILVAWVILASQSVHMICSLALLFYFLFLLIGAITLSKEISCLLCLTFVHSPVTSMLIVINFLRAYALHTLRRDGSKSIA